jgi:2-polyprenyl-3-methyl-5-hydroxy-6-metoxy-1,4-benzoquinol methylase
MKTRIPLVDRLVYAQTLSSGKKVLDIGGQKMPNCAATSPFAVEYSKIEQAASEYRIVDYQDKPEVDYVLDLNKPENISKLAGIIDEFKPDVILCMEVLEHINCHFEVMNVLAEAVTRFSSVVFITIPNNGNWIFNALGWNQDHTIAFFKDIAWRFITRSSLGKHQVEIHACMQKYVWYWWIAYILSFRQPFSWGFTIRQLPTSGR